ncbi:MAG: beta strand repeat-containing protein, partial [Phycisphaerae bacterium]
SAPALAFGAEAFVHVNTGSTLTINSAMSGATGLSKTSGGTLVINPGASAIAGVGGNTISGGSLAANGGTLRLGMTNAYTPNTFLRVSPGATFDLGGNLQQFAGVFTDAAVAQTAPGQQGTITSTGGTGHLVVNTDARNWAGQITGTVNVMRGGSAAWTVYSDNTYTGQTVLNGNNTLLRDAARLSGTSALAIDYATLTIDNNVGSLDLADRVNDAAPVTLRGGTIVYTGRAQTASSEAMGILTLAQGSSDILVGNTAGGVSSTELTFASIARSSADATINIRNQNAIGIAGSGARLKFATPPTLSNRIIGAWMVVGGNDFATYSTGNGVGNLGQTGFASYDATVLAAATATQNIRTTATQAVPNGGLSINTLVMSGNAPVTFATGADTLNLVGGGLIKTGNNTVSIGATLDSGRLTAGGSATGVQNLHVHINAAAANPLTINSRIVDNPGGGLVRLVYTAYNGGTLSLTNPGNNYSGGTVVNGGSAFTGTLNLSGASGAVVIPTGGLTINGATVNMVTNGGQIDPTNVVTMNGGGSVLTLVRDNTLAGLVINNAGGTVVPTVNTGGTLTLTGGITSTGSNVSGTPVISGRWDLGATGSKTVTVAPNQFNGLTINPLVGDLALTGLTGAAGLTKDGAGVLQFNTQAGYTGATTVNAGGIKFGAANAGPRWSAVNLNGANTRIDLGGIAGAIGSLTGTGMVVNSSTTAAALTVGGDNTSTSFAGGVRRFSESAGAVPSTSLTKVGSGTMTLTGASNAGGTLTVAQGGVSFTGATGTGTFGTYLVQAGGTLTTDGATPVANRLGTATGSTLNIGGGTVNLAGTAETFGTLTVSGGGGTLNLAAGAGSPLTVNVGTLTAVQAGGSLLIRGSNFGAAPGNGVATVNVTTFNVPAGQGTGANGTVTMAVRPDIIGDASATGAGTAFVTRDTAGYLRPLTAGEQASAFGVGPVLGAPNATTNFAFNSSVGVATNTSANTLALNNGGGIALGLASAGIYDGTGLTALTVSTGGILARSGNTGIATGIVNTASNAAFQFHVVNDTVGTTVLGVDAYLGTMTGGLNKHGDGTLNLNKSAYYTGTTTVNAGTLNLNAGANTLLVTTTSTVPGVGALTVNGGSLNLNGNNQAVGTLASTNTVAGGGGTITNGAGGSPVVLTSVAAGASTFGGSLAGNLTFTKTGNNALTLTGVSTHTGQTIVQANTLTLRDAGSILNTSAILANYGTLAIDQSGANPGTTINPVRVNPATPVTLTGGGLTFTSGVSLDSTATIDNVTAAAGHSTFTITQAPVGSTGALTIGNIDRGADATVTFNGGNSTGFFSTLPGLNISQMFIGSINGAPIPANITNKILGGWAIVNNGEFATYVQGTTTGANGLEWGVSTMNNTTATGLGIAQTNYDATTVAAGNNPTVNVRINGTGIQTIAAGGATINALAVRALLTNLNLTNASDTLNLVSGGLTLTIGGTTLGTGGIGQLTAGGTQSSGIARLYIHSATAGNTIAIPIIDNGSGAQTRLIANVISSTLALTAANTYTGGTVVNGAGTLNLGGSGVTIPAGGLTINNVAVAMLTNPGQIASSNDVTLNGGGSLTLVGSNTLNTLTFNGTGGTATPTVATATSLSLSGQAAITAVNDNLATTPTISGTALSFTDATPTITTSGQSPVSLIISAPITSSTGAVHKAGAGSLVLSGAGTYANGFALDAGTLVFGASSTGPSGAPTAGPVGTGTLTVAATAVLQSGAAAQTIANAVTTAGALTFGGNVAVNNLTLSGPVTFGGGTPTVTVTNPLVTGTISSILTVGASGLTKDGLGALTLTPTNGIASTTVSASTNLTVANSAGLVVGQAVSGTGIPAGTFVSGIVDGTNVTLSQPATAAGAVTINFGNFYSGPTNVNAGILKLGSSSALPPGSAVTVAAGAELYLNGASTLLPTGVTGTGTITNAGAAASTLIVGGT